MLTCVHTRIVHAGMHTHTHSHKNKPTHYRNYLTVGISDNFSNGDISIQHTVRYLETQDLLTLNSPTVLCIYQFYKHCVHVGRGLQLFETIFGLCVESAIKMQNFLGYVTIVEWLSTYNVCKLFKIV